MTEQNSQAAPVRTPGRDVKVGDDLWLGGVPHRITRIEPYVNGPNATRDLASELWDGKARVGYSDSFGSKVGKDAWAITLDPAGGYDITC